MRSLLKIPKKLHIPQRNLLSQFRFFSTKDDYAKQDLKHSIIDAEKGLPLWEIKNRTSLMFTLSEAHGMLNKALNILTSNKINMTRIQSKPSKFIENDWRKVDFHVDIEGTNDDKNVIRAIA